LKSLGYLKYCQLPIELKIEHMDNQKVPEYGDFDEIAEKEYVKDLKKLTDQNKRFENKITTDRLNRFDETVYKDTVQKTHYSEYDKEKGKNKEEFKHASTLPQSELDACALKYLKTEANKAMNQLALLPENINLNKKFQETQRNLRNWRGSYITKKCTEHNEVNSFMSRGEDVPDSLNYHNFLVTFSLSTYDNDDSPFEIHTDADFVKRKSKLVTTFNANVTHFDKSLSTMDANDIMEIITQMNMNEIPENSYFTGGHLTDILFKIKEEHIDSGKHSLGIPFQSIPFSEVSRYAMRSLQRGEQNITVTGNSYYYNINVNKIMPSKYRIYHNPKIVQRMICDILRAPMEPMQVDLTLRDMDHILQWTVHRIAIDEHAVHHFTYMDKFSDGLFELPDKLEEIRKACERSIVCKSLCYSMKKDELSVYNELQLLNTHAHLTQKILYDDAEFAKLVETNFAQPLYSYKNSIDTLHVKDKQHAFVYEYGEYTVIANTIFYKPDDINRRNVTSYTIIHWNHGKSQHHTNGGGGGGALVNSRLQTFDHRLNGLQELAGYMQQEMKNFQVFQYNPVLVDHSMTENLDYFIPAIFYNRGYAAGEEYNAQMPFSGFFIKSPSFQQRVLLESKRYEMHIWFIKHIMPVFGLPSTKEYDETWFGKLEQLMYDYILSEDEKLRHDNREKIIGMNPGWVAEALMRIHKGDITAVPEGKTKEEIVRQLLPAVKYWTLEWYAFLSQNDFGITVSSPQEFQTLANNLVKVIESRRRVQAYASGMIARASGKHRKNQEETRQPGLPPPLPEMKEYMADMLQETVKAEVLQERAKAVVLQETAKDLVLQNANKAV
jgi:hypothetical protein